LSSWREPAPRPTPTKSEHDAAVGAFRKAFNKLSKSNFDKISTTLLTISMPTKSAFEAAVTMVFEKALRDKFFQRLYARLSLALGNKEGGWCEVVIDERPDGTLWWAFPVDPDRHPDESKECHKSQEVQGYHGPYKSKEEASAAALKEVDFRRALLSRCQLAFQKAALPGSLTDDTTRKEYFSTVTFIGELFVERLAPLAIVYICLSALIGSADSDDAPSEDQVEAMSVFMTTVGKVFKAVDAGQRNLLPLCLETLDKWSKNKALPSRLRFGCMDVLELARRDWTPRASMAGKRCVA
jgi:hypothetical protein